jgi:hypothetical protein
MSKTGDPKSETGGLTLEPPASRGGDESPMGFAQGLLEESPVTSPLPSAAPVPAALTRTVLYPHSAEVLAQLLSTLFPEENPIRPLPATGDAAQLDDFDIGPSIIRPPASITKPSEEEADGPIRATDDAADVLTDQANELVEVVLVGTDSDSNKEIHLIFKEDIFAGMHLRLVTTPVGLEAIFMVQDKDARRTIEGQVDDIMARLSKRGLRIASHRIEEMSSP